MTFAGDAPGACVAGAYGEARNSPGGGGAGSAGAWRTAYHGGRVPSTFGSQGGASSNAPGVVRTAGATRTPQMQGDLGQTTPAVVKARRERDGHDRPPRD